MEDINKIKNIYFLGIGGIGMSAIARYFKLLGAEVTGYDKAPTPLTDALIAEGILVHFDKNINLIPKEIELVIHTPAVPKDHAEYIYLKEKGYTIKKRSEILALITRNTFTVAVSGTHGKTTITSMIAHILMVAGKDLLSFIGGISKNYQTNLLVSGKNPISVVEADEFDMSFLQLYPDITVISAMDADHLDVYGSKDYLVESFCLFANQVRNNGKLVLKKSLNLPGINAQIISYSAKENADFYAENIRIENSHFCYTICCPGKVKIEVNTGVPGIHNVENAIAATAVAIELGIAPSVIKEALESYTGVQRRFDYRIKEENLVFIDDYAHHPEEIKACIKAVRDLYPGKKITAVFQPHLYTRTRDLANGFSESLALVDDLILLDIYPARELPIEGITSEWLLGRIKMKNKILCDKESLVDIIAEKAPEIIVTIGAGDIDQLVQPIETRLRSNLLNSESR